MPDDLAVVPLDAPTVEPALATSEPVRGIHLTGSQHRDRGGLSGLTGWLLIAIAGVGMFISTPPSAGPDEPVHEVTAWYLSEHVLPPGSAASFSVPVSFSVKDPCFSQEREVTASCAPSRSTTQVLVPTSMVLGYSPPYYWVVGVGQRLTASLVGIEYADVGGRLASFILNLGALLLLSLYMRRRNPLWGAILLLVSTPMAVFLGIVVNPSGWEITCGLVMAAALSEAAWSRESFGSGDWPKTTALVLVVASVALSLARPLGFVWASGLTVSAIALAPSTNRRLLLRVGCAVAPGIVLGMLWTVASLTLSSGGPSSAVTSHPSALYIAATFVLSLLYFPLRLDQMFGVLGWLDTPPPVLLFFIGIMAWGALLIRLPSIRKAAALCAVFGIVILPSAIEAIGWGSSPGWWQGRYTLPFALGFMLLWLLRSGQFITRTISVVSGISLLSLGLMVWVNAIRYDFGLNGYDLPASLGQQGISPVRLWLSVAVGALLLLVSGYLLVQAWRMERDLRPRLQPKTISTP
jgi:hypothetical protein